MQFNKPKGFGEIKPQAGVVLDRSHPSAFRLLDTLLFNEGAKKALNYSKQNQVTAITGTPVMAGTKLGIAGVCAGGASYDIPNWVNYAATDFTLRCIFYPVSWPADFANLVGKTVAELGVFFDTAGSINFVNFGGTGDGTPVALALTAGRLWDFTMTVAGGVATFYKNGIPNATTISGFTTTAGTGPLVIGRAIDGGTNANIRVVLLQTWSRALKQSEIKNLYTNPFDMFVQPRQRYAWPGAAAGGFKPYWATTRSRVIGAGVI